MVSKIVHKSNIRRSLAIT